MSEVQPIAQPAVAPAKRGDSTLTGCLLYLLLVLLPIGLKLASLTRVAAWSWWKVTALLWVPWGLLLVVSALGWLVHLVAQRPGRA